MMVEAAVTDDRLAAAGAELRQGSFERAAELYTAHLASRPQAAAAYRGRALARFQLKQWADAASDFAAARELDPEELDNHVGQALSLAMHNQIYEALDVFEALLRQHPTYVRGHVQLGLLYYRLCATAKGRQHMEIALGCQPSPDERRLIEQVLQAQRQLDHKRHYRPDFEALHHRP